MSHRPLDVEFGLPMSPQIRTGPIKKIWTLKLENKKIRTCYVASNFFFWNIHLSGISDSNAKGYLLSIQASMFGLQKFWFPKHFLCFFALHISCYSISRIQKCLKALEHFEISWGTIFGDLRYSIQILHACNQTGL